MLTEENLQRFSCELPKFHTTKSNLTSKSDEGFIFTMFTKDKFGTSALASHPVATSRLLSTTLLTKCDKGLHFKKSRSKVLRKTSLVAVIFRSWRASQIKYSEL